MPEAPPGGLVSYLAFLAGGAGVSGPRERPGLPVTATLLSTYFLRKIGATEQAFSRRSRRERVAFMLVQRLRTSSRRRSAPSTSGREGARTP